VQLAQLPHRGLLDVVQPARRGIYSPIDEAARPWASIRKAPSSRKRALTWGMEWWSGALVAALGAFVAELAEIDLVRRKTGRLPWNRRQLSTVNGQTYAPVRVYLIGVPIRLVAAGIVGGIYASADQVSGAIGAFTLGTAASLFVSRISDQKDLGDQAHPSELPRPIPDTKRKTSARELPLADGEKSGTEARKAENA
jgi:hypothetical protein